MKTLHSKPQTTLTIDIDTILVQHVAAQLGESLGQLGQLCIQLLRIKLRMVRVMVVGANSIHPSGCSILLRPEEKGIYIHYREILTEINVLKKKDELRESQ